MATTAVAPKRTGPPSSYDPAYCDMLIEFFELAPICEPPVEYQEPQERGGSLKREVRAICGTVPTFEKFAAMIGTTTVTMWKWSREYKEFGEAYLRAKQAQANFFVQGLSQGIMNPTGAIFVAKNILGWKDKTEIEQVSSQDTQDAGNMRDALAAMTTEELAQFATLVGNAQSRVIGKVSGPA